MPEIPSDAWPEGDRTSWSDDDGRVFHDFLDETTRPYTAAENAAADARAEAARLASNAEQLRSAASDALGENRTFLALATPTNAQTLSQVRALTRQMNVVIRLVVNEVGSTD